MSDDSLEEIRSLRKILIRVSTRLDELEREAESAPKAAPEPPLVTAPPQSPMVHAPPRPAMPAAPPQPPKPAPVAAAMPKPEPPPTPSTPRENLEVTIGRYWLNRIGILSLVLGTAFFLVYSFQYLGPLAKVAMGYGVGVALLVLGLRLERKPGLAWYALGLMGGGWAVLYFTTFAMYHVAETKVLSSAAVDVVLLLIVAAGAVRHALTKRSQTITMFAFLLGFLTTGISEVTGFTFLSSIILIGALVILAARFRWHLLLLYGVIGSYLTHMVAVQPHMALAPSAFPGLTPAQSFFWLNAAFLTLYFLGYSLGALALDEKEESRQNALLTSTVLNGPVYALTLLPLLPGAYPGKTYIALLLLGAVSLAFSLAAGRRGLRAVSSAHLLLGLTFATLAIPLKLTHRWTGLFWYAEVAILCWLGVRFHRWAYRLFALVLGITALFWAFPYELLSRTRFQAYGWSISWPWTVGLTAVFCYGIAAMASRRLTPDRFRWSWERHSFHLYAASACVMLWIVTVAESSSSRVSLYWSLEAAGVTLLGWAIRDRGIRLFGALWYIAPVCLTLVGLMGGYGARFWSREGAIGLIASLVATSVRYRTAPPPPQFRFERILGSLYVVTASLLLAAFLAHELPRPWISLGVALEAFTLLMVGFLLRDRSYRASGLVIFPFLILKLIYFDLPGLSPWNQTGSLAVVAILYAVSFLYRAGLPEPGFLPERFLKSTFAVIASLFLAGVLWHDLPFRWHTFAWALEALALAGIGFALPERSYRASALVIFPLALFKLFCLELVGFQPWNQAGALGVVGILFVASLLYRVRLPKPGFTLEAHLTNIFAVTASFLLAAVFWHDLAARWLSLAWALEGLALVVTGFRLPDKYFRISGLLIFSMLLLKILFVDLAAAQTIYRILSFVVAGVILLLASYGYAKFNARETRAADPADPPPV